MTKEPRLLVYFLQTASHYSIWKQGFELKNKHFFPKFPQLPWYCSKMGSLKESNMQQRDAVRVQRKQKRNKLQPAFLTQVQKPAQNCFKDLCRTGLINFHHDSERDLRWDVAFITSHSPKRNTQTLILRKSLAKTNRLWICQRLDLFYHKIIW